MSKVTKILAYVANFIMDGIPGVINLWVTEKDVNERVDRLLAVNNDEDEEEEDGE